MPGFEGTPTFRNPEQAQTNEGRKMEEAPVCHVWSKTDRVIDSLVQIWPAIPFDLLDLHMDIEEIMKNLSWLNTHVLNCPLCRAKVEIAATVWRKGGSL